MTSLPKENKEKKILFLPDPDKEYDYTNQKRLINIKRSLGTYKSVDRWIQATDRFQNAMEENSKGREISFHPFELEVHQSDILDAWADVILDLAADTAPRDQCICSSRKEFRKCCSKLIQFSNG